MEIDPPWFSYHVVVDVPISCCLSLAVCFEIIVQKYTIEMIVLLKEEKEEEEGE